MPNKKNIKKNKLITGLEKNISKMNQLINGERRTSFQLKVLLMQGR